jgi:hypothetical protein
VDIVKFTNGVDANDPDAAGVPDISAGSTVTWTYRVTNTGSTHPARANVQVTDNVTGVTPTFTSEISGNGDTVFDPNEVWLYTATGTALNLSITPPPSGTFIVPNKCTQGGTRSPANAYTNIGTAQIPGATDTDPSSYCNPAATPCPAGTFTTSISANGDISIKYDQWPAPNDNTYGVNAVGWGTKGHTFGNLTGSDHAGFQVVDPTGAVKLDFAIDYLSAQTGTPSGYASLGPFGGDGRVNTGTLTPADLTWDTSLARNLNNLGYFASGVQVKGKPGTAGCPAANAAGCADLLVDSPKTLNTVDSYTMTADAAAVFNSVGNTDSAEAPGWNYHDTYFVTLKAAKLASLGFNPANFQQAGFGECPIGKWCVTPNPDELHNSPAKPCPCPTQAGQNLDADFKTELTTFNGQQAWKLTFTQGLGVNDNMYTATSPTPFWGGRQHKFADLTGSDKAEFLITNGSTTLFDFFIDYFSAKSGTASGYGSLGPFGGDGSCTTAVGGCTTSNTNILGWTTSLDDNFNTTGFFSGGSQVVGTNIANLLTTAPPPANTSDETAGAAAPFAAWNYVNSYTVYIKASALPGNFNASMWSVPFMHNSPAKPTSSTCPPGGTGTPQLAVTKYEAKGDKQVKITISNTGTADAFITAINGLTWPQATNGNLMEIKLDGDSLWKAGVNGAPAAGVGSPVSLTTAQLVADQNKRKIGKNSSDQLILIFKNNAATNLKVGYAGTVSFQGVSPDLTILPQP